MTFEIERWPEDEYEWDHETGTPGLAYFANAVQVWAFLQQRDVSVAEAARVFNVEPVRIVEAVDDHYWMDLDGPRDDYTRLMICHEGE